MAYVCVGKHYLVSACEKAKVAQLLSHRKVEKGQGERSENENEARKVHCRNKHRET